MFMFLFNFKILWLKQNFKLCHFWFKVVILYILKSYYFGWIWFSLTISRSITDLRNILRVLWFSLPNGIKCLLICWIKDIEASILILNKNNNKKNIQYKKILFKLILKKIFFFLFFFQRISFWKYLMCAY